MNKQMMNTEELEQVNGGNWLGDAWDWVCKKLFERDNKPHTREQEEQDILDKVRPKTLPMNTNRFDKCGRVS